MNQDIIAKINEKHKRLRTKNKLLKQQVAVLEERIKEKD